MSVVLDKLNKMYAVKDNRVIIEFSDKRTRIGKFKNKLYQLAKLMKVTIFNVQSTIVKKHLAEQLIEQNAKEKINNG